MSAYDLTGTILGQYELRELLGVGGMSTVYRAFQLTLQREVAVKVLSYTLASRPGYIERFTREARTAAALEHTHIIPIYDYGVQSDISYVVMRLLTGGSLAQRMQQSLKGPSIPETLEIVKALSSALTYAHNLGVIHRDIKPSNVMFDNRGNAFLVDFGIAKILGSATDLTNSGAVMGSPQYMAPELWRVEEVTPATDQYALAVVAYTLLAGSLPFEAATPSSLMYKHLEEMPPALSSFRQGLPEGLDSVLSRALSKDPSDRFPTVYAFAQALEAACGPQPGRSTGFLTAPIRRMDTKDVLVSGAQQAAYATGAEIPRAGREASAAGRRYVLPWMLLIGVVVVALVVNVILASIATQGPFSASNVGSNAILGLYMFPAFQSPFSVNAVLIVAGIGLIVAAVGLTGWTVARRSRLRDRTAGTTFLTELTSIQSINDVGDRASPGARAEPAASDATSVLAVGKLPVAVQLVVVQSNDDQLRGKSVKLDSMPFTIGRQAGDLNFETDPAISRLHCQIDYDGSMYTITDLGSANGTFVDGRGLVSNQSAALLYGSSLRLSNQTVLVFSQEVSPSMPDMTDKLIASQYRLRERLKTSGKGAVYSANDLKLDNRLVAVKLLSPDLSGYAGYRELFNREAKTAASLKHPHIVKIYTFGTESLFDPLTGPVEIPYIVMELLEGGTLSRKLDDFGTDPVPLTQIVTWLRPLADALDYAHREGVIHSGIKPGAIVFDKEGQPYITDFAIAQRAGQGDKMVIVGAPAFIAPEQWEGESLGGEADQSDQYAIAVLTYLMVAGELPFEGQENPKRRKRNFAKGAAPVHQVAVSNGRDDVPASVSEVLAKGLSLEPEDRFETISAFVDSFEQAMLHKSARPQVFISYQRDSSAGWAVLFQRELSEKHHVEAFLDVERIDGAVQFSDRLRKAIEGCDVFICFLAGPTLASAWVQEEIKLAYSLGKPMIPVFQESYQKPARDSSLAEHIQTLLNHDGIPLLDRQNIYIQSAIDDLARMVRITVGRS